MPVYVDKITDYKGSVGGYVGRVSQQWCHMWADTPEELHAMAAKIGMKRAWFQLADWWHLCHYDLVPSKRAKAVSLGAVEVDAFEYFRQVREAGKHEVAMTPKAEQVLAERRAKAEAPQ